MRLQRSKREQPQRQYRSLLTRKEHRNLRLEPHANWLVPNKRKPAQGSCAGASFPLRLPALHERRTKPEEIKFSLPDTEKKGRWHFQ